LDGFPEVKSLADVLFDCAFVVYKSTLLAHMLAHRALLQALNSMKATVWRFYFHQSETRVKLIAVWLL
jgi:hypothetical protein